MPYPPHHLILQKKIITAVQYSVACSKVGKLYAVLQTYGYEQFIN